MAQTTSGKVLREARERKGYDLNTVARRLRIRPDILRAIEAGDFNAMPPRGYTRNMVNAYAKLLGLNPTEIVNLYLDEAYAQQVERARGTGPSSGFNMKRETRRSRTQLGVGEGSGAETRAIHPIETTSETGKRQFTRMLYDDGTRFSRDDYGVTRQRTERPGKSERDFSSHHSGYDSSSSSFLRDGTPSRGGRSIYAGQTPMQYSASRLPSFLQSRTALIALGVIVVAIIIVILVVVIGSGNKPTAEDASKLPVSGISDTTSSGSAASTPVEVAPTSARAVYSVKSGEDCYVEIYENGSMTAENLTGPTEKTVDVTGTWTITTWSPESLSLTVDGQKAELKESSEYGGMYAYTVDFSEILKQWNTAHPNAATGAVGAATAAATANSSNTNAQAQGTTGSTGNSTSVNNTGTNRDDGTNYVEPENLETMNESDETLDDGQQEEDEYYDEEYTEENVNEEGEEA